MFISKSNLNKIISEAKSDGYLEGKKNGYDIGYSDGFKKASKMFCREPKKPITSPLRGEMNVHRI